MTQIKNRLTSQITYIDPQHQLILKSTMLEPNLISLALDKQPYCSHLMLSINTLCNIVFRRSSIDSHKLLDNLRLRIVFSPLL